MSDQTINDGTPVSSVSTGTTLSRLRAERTRILTALQEAPLKPNASGSGHTIDHVGYRMSLLDALSAIEKQIDDEVARADGPWEVDS
jgi:hypothetical protein